MKITKAVIPAAGLGTRMLPAAKAVAKELMPILDRPTIQYVVEEAVAGGIDDVLLITSSGKQAVEAHFKPDPELDQRLKTGNRESLLASLNELIAKVSIHSVDQPHQRGLGDAVLQARKEVGNRPFACLLGDTIFSGDTLPIQQLLAAYAKLGTSIIGVEEVLSEKVSRYGIVGGREISPGLLKLSALVEKPSADSAPSNLAIAARYILTPAIFDCLAATPPGKNGEIQLTDALQLLLKREPIHAVVLSAKRHDIGNALDWLKTNLHFAARDPALWRQIAPLLDELKQKSRAKT